MSASTMPIKLLAPSNETEWAAYHDIRSRVLFGRGRYGVYDPNHPDEHKDGNFPLVLVSGSRFIGVVRIDVSGDVAQLRRVAIDQPWQGQGYGRHLLALAEAFAVQRGAKRTESAVAPDAVRFYEKCGYQPVEDPRARGSSVRMLKNLVPGAQQYALRRSTSTDDLTGLPEPTS